MHHLILVREFDQQMSGSGCCDRVAGDAAAWGAREGEGRLFAEQRRLMERLGEIYRAVREAFGEEVQITVVDPRNQLAFLPLVLRDAVRFHVPALTCLRTLVSASVATGIFDGQLVFQGEIPPPQQVVERIRGRLQVHRVGAAPEGRGDVA